MQKKLANVLRAVARRLDPPAPLTIVMRDLNQTTASGNAFTAQINWEMGGNR